MSHLHRELAPISETAWTQIESRPDPNLDAVTEAAKRAALAEDHIVFNGFKEAHITGMVEASPRLILGGPVVWGPAVDGALVLSIRRDDFELTCGQDMALGYVNHGSDSVQLFLEESISFRVLTPEAAVPLVHPG